MVRSRVTPHGVGRCRNATEWTDPIRGTALAGFGAAPRIQQALRKGEFQKQSTGLFLKEGCPASEGVPTVQRYAAYINSQIRFENSTGSSMLMPSIRSA